MTCLVNTIPSSSRLRSVGTPTLLDRIQRNDEALRCLRIGPELFMLPDTPNALLRNHTIRSVVFVRVAPHLISESSFAKLMECMYHLPLRSLQLSGPALPSNYLQHVLHLVEYSCGVGVGCQWTLEAADLSHTQSDRHPSPTLAFLDISGHVLSVALAAWMGRVLFHPLCTLRRVDLCECGMGNDGLRALLHGAAQSPRCGLGETATHGPMEVLALRWNGVTEDDSLSAFLDVMDGAGCGTRVEAHGNYLSAELHQRLVKRGVQWRQDTEAAQARDASDVKDGKMEAEEEEEEENRNNERTQQSGPSVATEIPNSALELLVQIGDESPPSLFGLRTLASLLQRE